MWVIKIQINDEDQEFYAGLYGPAEEHLHLGTNITQFLADNLDTVLRQATLIDKNYGFYELATVHEVMEKKTTTYELTEVDRAN